MALRCKAKEVSEAIRDYDKNINLSIFMQMGNVLTSRVAANDSGGVLDSDELKWIEVWLSAFFYETRDHEVTQQRTGKASGQYAGKFGELLKRNRAGQNAILLDETGYLASIGQPKATMSWLGKPPSTQIDYVDRD